MVKLSIIIPYFETYELTKKLLSELIIQCTTPEVEVILIDDGCNEDRFDYILDNISEYYNSNNFYIRHQDNLGVAKTRNKGIDFAKGKYIAFIDCDDMITMDYVQVLLDAINKYDDDIINFNWLDITNNKVHIKPRNYAPWKAIYKKESLKKFREDKEYGSEDIWFQGELEAGINEGRYTIRYLDRVLYIYNSNRVGSLFWKKMHKED